MDIEHLLSINLLVDLIKFRIWSLNVSHLNCNDIFFDKFVTFSQKFSEFFFQKHVQFIDS